MRVYQRSRRELFEQIERQHLRPLPLHPYVLCETKEARVHIDYHVAFNGHYYSVPSALVSEPVRVRATGTTVEIFHKSQRVASHLPALPSAAATRPCRSPCPRRTRSTGTGRRAAL